jgi:uncharacterized protein (DUF58 family)
LRRHGGPIILISLLLLVLVGAGLRRWEPVAIALPVFIIYGLVCVTYSVSGPVLSVKRRLDPESVFPDQETVVKMTITNETGSKLGLVEIFDMLPNSVEITKGRNHRLFTLGPYEEKTIEYTVKFHALGEVTLGPMKWRVRDHMSFFFDEGINKTKTVVEVRRLIEDARKLHIQPTRTTRPFGQIPARVKGTGSEFYGLRDYSTSDSLRMVNWKASARRGRLISNEYENEKLGDVVLILDMREVFRVGEGATNTIDASMNGALAVAQRVLQERNRLSIVYFRKQIGWISGITTRRHIKDFLDKGEFPEELETYPIHWLPWILKVSFPTKAYLVVISTLLDDDMAKMLQEIALVGYDMMVISPSPASSCVELYHKPTLETATRLSRKLIMLKRKNRILKLSKTMTVIDWDFAEPLALTLKKAGKVRGGARWRRRRPMAAT